MFYCHFEYQFKLHKLGIHFYAQRKLCKHVCLYLFYHNRFCDKDVGGFEIEFLDHILNKFYINLYKHEVILFQN
jgi:hypothetical protein